MQIIDGRKIKKEILEEVKSKVLKLSFVPIFYDILIGDDKASALYVRIKSKNAESVGIKFRTINFPDTVNTEEVIKEIENLNKVPYVCGIIIQLPIPENLDRKRILDSIDLRLDVDSLGSETSKKFYNNTGTLGYPTAKACLKILDSLDLELKNKKIVVLGQGILVGKPVSHLLQSRGLEIDSINTKTENSLELIKNADIIISGIGKGKFITGDMIKEGVVIIDAGTSEENGSIVGDVDIESVKNKASFITPNPGGVGPVTVAMLLKNVILVANQKNNNE